MALIDRRSALNVFVRGLTIGSRFLLMFMLGRYFTTYDVGQYGLFYTTVSLSVLAVGFDFYTFANREVLNAKPSERIGLLRGQLLFYGVSYLIFVIPVAFIFFFRVLPMQYLLVFIGILITEHLSQELYRLFTILSEPVFANFILFVRSGAWVLLLTGYFLFKGVPADALELVFFYWLTGSAVSLIIGIIKLVRLTGGHPVVPVSRGWYRNGIRTAGMFFISTLALLAIEHANRYMIKYWCGLPDLGVFTLFSQISNIINVVVFTLLIMVIFPKLIEAYNSGDTVTYFSTKKMFRNKVLMASIVLFLLAGVFIFPLLSIMGNEAYDAQLPVFYVLLSANVFINLSYVYHYGLYAMKQDRRLLVSSLCGALISVVLNVVMITSFGLMGAALALLASYVCIVLMKRYQLAKAENSWQADFGNGKTKA